MLKSQNASVNRRSFMKRTAAVAAAGGAIGGGVWFSRSRASRSLGKKVIVIGLDGLDPSLCETMMRDGLLPNLQKLRDVGGFSRLKTTAPPQSPVAWASFINGSGPGSHGIFDFIHRRPENPSLPFYSAAETLPAEGFWEIGDHRMQLPFWPINHRPPVTVLRRQGVPFWDYLDAARIPSTFYDLPANYPPSPSQYGYHRCICGMGTPDMLGTHGTYQHFSETVPQDLLEEGGGKRMQVTFDKDSAKTTLTGPENTFLKTPVPTTIEMEIHRDARSNAAMLELQGKKIILSAGTWSDWIKLDFSLSGPRFVPAQHATGICRFYLQEVSPNFRLYATPINCDPSNPSIRISEPAGFIQDVSSRTGLFYTTGFQEDHKALSNGIFRDDEFEHQATMVLEERLALFEYAINNYEDGFLFFYFSSSDLQSHMFWWNTEEKHPTRSQAEAKKYFNHLKTLYRRLDAVIGDVHERFGGNAVIFVMSDHGFANFRRQFNLNSWLRDRGLIHPRDCSSVLHDADWSHTQAYGLGINGLYLNLKGRERDGIVDPGEQREELMAKLVSDLESLRDEDGQRVIRQVYRTDRLYSGDATALAPDLIVGYARGYRASWETCLGEIAPQMLTDNTSAWSADHCADPAEVPGVLCCNRAIRSVSPAIVDLAPTVLSEFGIPAPSSMSGRNLFCS